VTSRIIDDPTTLNELIHVHVFGGSVEPTKEYDISQAVESGSHGAGANWGGAGRDVWVRTYQWNGSFHRITYESDNFGHRLYDDRHGKPYQADIEAHVAAYRGHIPDYVGDGAMLAKGIAKYIGGQGVRFLRTLNDSTKCVIYGANEAIHSDLSIAFWNAAIQASGYSEEEA
jgi:hypothetical protein